MIARGIVRCGSLTSSPAVDTASRPMKEKKIVPAAAPIPETPNGAKSLRLPESNAVKPMTMNMPSTDSLMMTMTVLTAADSLAPRISNSAQSAIRMTAGRLSTPGLSSHGACESESGRWTPITLSMSLFRYWLQPTATAAVDTPYSSSRHAATPIATTSPSAA